MVDSAVPARQGVWAARQEFACQFGALYRAGGCPPLRVLAAASRQRIHMVRGAVVPAPVSAQRISDWKSGRNVPFRFESLVPVLVVLIEGARRRGNIHGVQLSLRAWRRLWAQARAGRSEPAEGDTEARERQPAGSEAPWFAGRRDAIGTLLGLVEDAGQASGESRVVLLTGASGVGKSVLLTDGLLPALGSEQSRRWVVRTVVPDPGTPLVAVDLIAAIGDEKSCSRAIVESGTSEPAVRHLVVLDQFDRVLNDPGFAGIAREFFIMLRRLAQHAAVLISLRSASNVLAHFAAGGIEHREFELKPMTSGELRGAMREVLTSGGDRVDNALEEVLMVRVGGIRGDGDRYGREPAELLVLMKTLRAMLRGRTGTGFRIGSYRRVGGVDGVVHGMADSLWAELSTAEKTEAKRVLLELIAVSDDSGDSRRRLSYTDFRHALGANSIAERVFEQLVAARIVTVDGFQVYLSHELLLTWPPLAGWIGEQRSLLQRI
ncbi:hypothetical protein [Nocardia sp. NPDC019395]|uniref:nSTAND1 domain-containing NTPase n=1 Tax=Nocardia sp. NPDC019395 TaxID=3154686 RepID=UPI00340A8216